MWLCGFISGILLCVWYGGCGILYPLSPYIKTLHTGSNRLCSKKLCDSVGTSFLLICVYLPTDFQSYHNTLVELEGYIDSQSFDHYLISGDFNVDFDRGGDNVQLLCNFMDGYSLVAADLNFRSAIHFTCERDDCAVRSWPDHIICSMSMVNPIEDVSKFDQGVNHSDQYLILNFFMTFPPHLHHLLPLLYLLLVHIDLTGLEPLLLTYITIMHLCCGWSFCAT